LRRLRLGWLPLEHPDCCQKCCQTPACCQTGSTAHRPSSRRRSRRNTSWWSRRGRAA